MERKASLNLGDAPSGEQANGRVERIAEAASTPDAVAVDAASAAKGNPHKNVVRLITRYVSSGLIVDLGPGAGALGQSLQQAGYEYLTVGAPPDAIHLLRERQVRHADATLVNPMELGESFAQLGQVKAICLIDTLGRLSQPESLLRWLADHALDHASPLLVVSEPNIGHRDVALNLLAGRWTPIGTGEVLDAPRQSYFTRRSLLDLLGRQGWQVVAQLDLEEENSELHDPAGILHMPTLVGDHLRHVSTLFNADSTISRFCWLLQPPVGVRSETAASSSPTSAPTPTANPLVSVMVRTQGLRNELLVEALYSIYAQECDDYEVVLCFHNLADTSGSLLLGVRRTLEKLPSRIQRKIRLIECHGRGRGAPLNTLLEAARGEYGTFLDDDDLLFANHISTLKDAVDTHGIGPMYQTFGAQRRLDAVEVGEGASGLASGLGAKVRSIFARQAAPIHPYSVSAVRAPWIKPFDPIAQQFQNFIPIFCIFLPICLIRQTSVRVNTEFSLAEDWDFWLRASQILKVITISEITAAQNVWNDTTTNTMNQQELQPIWTSMQQKRLNDQANIPLLLDGRVASLFLSREVELSERIRVLSQKQPPPLPPRRWPDPRSGLRWFMKRVARRPPVVRQIYPSKTRAGQPFNVQPDGRAALGVTCTRVTPSTVIVFGDTALRTVYSSPTLLTAFVPSRFFSKPGRFQVYLRNEAGTSKPAEFVVDP